LATASSLGDYETSLRGLQQTLNQAQSSLEAAHQTLGKWSKPLAELRAMQTPSQQLLTLLTQTRQSLLAELKAAGKRRDEQQSEVAKLELKISQFKQLHHLTTQEDVAIARSHRDASWHSIKTGEVDLSQTAQHFEALIGQADEVADRLLDNVEEATELQSLIHQLERERHSLAGIENQFADLDLELKQFNDQWHEMTTNLGLPDMALENIADWLAKRETALNEAVTCQNALQNFENMSKTIKESRLKLAESLGESGLAVSDTDSLHALRIQAENFIQSVDSAKTRQLTLTEQRRIAQPLVETLQRNANEAQAELNRWTGTWTEALAKTGLPPNSEIGTVEGALEIIGQIENNLDEIQKKRIERIDAMNADLQRLSAQAHDLALKVAPEHSHQASFKIILELADRLNQARVSQQETKRLRDSLRVANDQMRKFQEAIGSAEAKLQPLMEQAKVVTMDALNEAVARSDRQRQLKGDLAKAKASLLDGGDGLSRTQIEAEFVGEDLTQLAAELAQTNEALDETIKLQNRLSAELADANRALSEIGGSDAAAQAEAKRQEAIALMSNVAERYVRVATAAHLLRYSIDRYREDKQGPLLARTSTLFSRLTLGSFKKLVVDFDREPLALEGQRTDGRLVGISGMSDGTRDQLYLALRLAALELHLEQAMPLPFIADDLFINYDDDRSTAGLEALSNLSEKTQVIFLSHHEHLVPMVQEVFGKQVNIVFC
jgi:DNA repair exonuclease SbcCD ATPase subunit